MSTNQQIADVREFEEWRSRLESYRVLSNELAMDLERITRQETVARQILRLTAGRPEEAYENREAVEMLEELRDQRALLEKRIATVKNLMAGAEVQFARFNEADVRHQVMLAKMFAELPRQRA